MDKYTIRYSNRFVPQNEPINLNTIDPILEELKAWNDYADAVENQIREILRLTGLDVDSVTAENLLEFQGYMTAAGYELQYHPGVLEPSNDFYELYHNDKKIAAFRTKREMDLENGSCKLSISEIVKF